MWRGLGEGVAGSLAVIDFRLGVADQWIGGNLIGDDGPQSHQRSDRGAVWRLSIVRRTYPGRPPHAGTDRMVCDFFYR